MITDAEIRRIIFVKVDNTLPTPDHPSIAAAAAAIMEKITEAIDAAREDEADDRHRAQGRWD